MAKYVKCPRCDLNYILEGEDYCAVCKAELKIGPSLLYADDEDRAEEKLCPKCKSVYISIDEDCCDNCRTKRAFDYIEPESDLDMENDEKWRDYLDEDEKEDISNSGDDEEEMISLSKIQEEEENEFTEEEEEEEEFYEGDNSDEDEDFSFDESDFDETIEEDEEEPEEDEDF